MATTMNAETTTSGPGGDAETLNVVLLALTIIFAVSTVALVIYIIITKCRQVDRRSFAGSVKQDEDVELGTTPELGHQNEAITPDEVPVGNGQPSHAVVSPQESTHEEEAQDIVPELPLAKVIPKYSTRYKKNIVDVFGARTSLRPHESTVIVAQRVSNIGVLMATPEYQQSLLSQTPGPNVRTRKSMIHTMDLEGIMEEQMIDKMEIIKPSATSQLGRTPSSGSTSDQTLSPIDPRHKSIFCATQERGEEITKPEVDVSRGMFVTEVMTASAGGEIDLAAYGVKLVIPAGALPGSGTTTISLGIVWCSGHHPKLTGQQALLSPIISCEPHGLKLSKSAQLTIPHCAEDVMTDWKIHVKHSPTEATKKADWKEKINSKLVHNEKKNRVTFDINHFCLDCVVGEPTASSSRKKVVIMACAPPLSGTVFKIRVYCFNDYDDDDDDDEEEKKKRKDVNTQKKDQKREGSKHLTARYLSFYNDNQDLRLALSIDKESASVWNLANMSQQTQDMDFEDVWQSMCPMVDFVLSSGKTKSAKVMCAISGHQLNHPKKQQTLMIAEEVHVDIGRIDFARLDPVFPEKLRKQIVKLLDPSDDYNLVSNWQHLAEKMGKNVVDTTYMRHDASNRSPTLSLLQEWVDRGKTLQEFDDLMVDLRREDVHEHVTKVLQHKRKSGEQLLK